MGCANGSVAVQQQFCIGERGLNNRAPPPFPTTLPCFSFLFHRTCLHPHTPLHLRPQSLQLSGLRVLSSLAAGAAEGELPGEVLVPTALLDKLLDLIRAQHTHQQVGWVWERGGWSGVILRGRV